MVLNRQLLERLKSREKRKLEQINASVVTEDLLVITPLDDMEIGEFYKSSKYEEVDSLERMKDQLKLLVDITSKQHEQENFIRNGEELTLKPERENHVTRLLLPEFFFYRNKSPLTLDEFHQFILFVEDIAKVTPENLHLLLASIPVQDSRRGVLNFTLHVQAGANPIITPIAKVNPSGGDPIYSYNVSRNRTGEAASRTPTTLLPAKGTEGIPYGGVVECTTAGGAKFVTAVDICLDHAKQVSRKTFEEKLNQAQAELGLSYIPRQASQILTSNTMYPQGDSMMVKSVEHIDPRVKDLSARQEKFSKNLFEFIKENKSFRPMQNKYKDFKMKMDAGKIAVIDPPFGHDLSIIKTKKKVMHHFRRDLLTRIDAHNTRMLEEMVVRQVVMSQQTAPELIEQSMAKYVTQQVVMQAIEQMIKNLKPALIEKMFHKNSSRQQQYHLAIEYKDKINKIGFFSASFDNTLLALLDNFKSKMQDIIGGESLAQRIDEIKNQVQPSAPTV